MTGNEIFEITVDLISERLDSGLKDTTNTANYEKRSVGLINVIQNELSHKEALYKTSTIIASGTDSGTYVKLTLPADFLSLYQLLDSDLNPIENFKRVGNDIYVTEDFAGTLVYKYLMTPITSLTDTLDFDSQVCSTIIPNGLASMLLANENIALSNYFGQRYEELKSTLRQNQPAQAIAIKDMYDSKLSY